MTRTQRPLAALALSALLGTSTAIAQPAPAPKPAPTGEVRGDAWAHTAESLAASVQQADVVLPASLTGGAVWAGKFKDIPPLRDGQAPVVIFLHG